MPRLQLANQDSVDQGLQNITHSALELVVAGCSSSAALEGVCGAIKGGVSACADCAGKYQAALHCSRPAGAPTRRSPRSARPADESRSGQGKANLCGDDERVARLQPKLDKNSLRFSWVCCFTSSVHHRPPPRESASATAPPHSFPYSRRLSVRPSSTCSHQAALHRRASEPPRPPSPHQHQAMSR